jgi:hypothetical protein
LNRLSALLAFDARWLRLALAAAAVVAMLAAPFCVGASGQAFAAAASAAHVGCDPSHGGAEHGTPDAPRVRAHGCAVLCCVVAPAPLAASVSRRAARVAPAPAPVPARWASLTRAPPSPPPRG